MRRKVSRSSKSGGVKKKGQEGEGEECEYLLQDVTQQEATDNRRLRAVSDRQRKVSRWAPAAVATTFEDVPVFTICPYCTEKVVTKTHFKRGKSNCCYCCFWLTHVLDVFKDVIHTCPKCNKQIAIYNRFLLFKREHHTGSSGNTQAGTTTNQPQSVPDTKQKRFQQQLDSVDE